MIAAELAGAFDLEIDGAPAQPFGHGLIHSTWLVSTAQGPHLLQRLIISTRPGDTRFVEENLLL